MCLALYISMCLIFCIHICASKNSVQNGCHDCSQSTKNAFVWPLRSKIWTILTTVRKSFHVGLWRWMKHGSTTILRNQMKGQKSGFDLVKVNQSVRKRNNRLGKLWLVFFVKGSPTTGAYYTVLLYRLVSEIKKKRPHLKQKKMFHDDNAPSHTLNITHAKKVWIAFRIASASTVFFRPGLLVTIICCQALRDRWLYGRRFKSSKEVEWETEGYFRLFNKSYYLEGIEMLKDCWTCCIELKRDYIEK